jgi:hypothetical protein
MLEIVKSMVTLFQPDWETAPEHTAIRERMAQIANAVPTDIDELKRVSEIGELERLMTLEAKPE